MELPVDVPGLTVTGWSERPGFVQTPQYQPVPVSQIRPYQPAPTSQMQPYQPVKVLQRTQGLNEDKVSVSNPSQPPAASLSSSSPVTQMVTMSEPDASANSSLPASSELSQDSDWPNPYAQPGACDMGYGWQCDESLAQAQAQALGYDINASGRYVYIDNDMYFY